MRRERGSRANLCRCAGASRKAWDQHDHNNSGHSIDHRLYSLGDFLDLHKLWFANPPAADPRRATIGSRQMPRRVYPRNQTDDKLRPVATVVAAVAMPRQFAAASFEIEPAPAKAGVEVTS